MRDNISLSVVIPLYNCQRFVKQCLDSVYAQGMDEGYFEVIIVDDGSSDASPTIVSDYAARHFNMEIICQSNQGVACARNKALEHVHGRYVTFVDADDMLVGGSLRILLDMAMSNDADMVKAAHLKVREDAVAEDYGMAESPSASQRVMTGEEAIVSETKLDEGYCWGYLIRGSLIKDHGIAFKEKVMFMEDWAFITQVMLKSHRFVATDLLLYLYRDNASSCVANMTIDKLLSGCQSIEVVCQLCQSAAGAVRRRLTDNVCFNINIVLWFVIHYRKIFSGRGTITKELRRLLGMVDSSMTPPRLKVFRLMPSLYLMASHLLAKRKY